MEPRKHLDLGVAPSGTNQYSGKHRDLEMPQGFGYFPMGDRDRNRLVYGVYYVEDRISVDSYEQYLPS